MNSPHSPEPLVVEGATDANGYYQVSPGINEPGGLAVQGDVVSVYVDGGSCDATTSFVAPGVNVSGQWLNVTLQDKPTNPLLEPMGLALIAGACVAFAVMGIWMRARRKRKDEEAERGSGAANDGKSLPQRRRRRK
jgi:hypothetical protein